MLAPPATHNHSAELVRNAHDEAAERIEQPPLPKRMRLYGCNRTGSRKVVLDPCLALSDQPSLGDLNQHFHICERERVKIVATYEQTAPVDGSYLCMQYRFVPLVNQDAGCQEPTI